MKEKGKGAWKQNKKKEEAWKPSVLWGQLFNYEIKLRANGPILILCLSSGCFFFFFLKFSLFFFIIIPNNFVFTRIRNKQKGKKVVATISKRPHNTTHQNEFII